MPPAYALPCVGGKRVQERSRTARSSGPIVKGAAARSAHVARLARRAAVAVLPPGVTGLVRPHRARSVAEFATSCSTRSRSARVTATR